MKTLILAAAMAACLTGSARACDNDFQYQMQDMEMQIEDLEDQVQELRLGSSKMATATLVAVQRACRTSHRSRSGDSRKDCGLSA